MYELRVQVTRTAAPEPTGPGFITEVDPTLEANSEDPGKNTRYTIMFTAAFSNDDDRSLDAGTQELVIELEDFGFPGTVDE